MPAGAGGLTPLSPSVGGKLGLIAGGGALPRSLADHCRETGRPYFVIRLRGFADAEIAVHPGAEAGIAELGKVFDLLKREDCRTVCMAGVVKRPDFAALKPDLRGLRMLPGAIAAARKGDDALLRFVLGEFEREGFAIEGADAVFGDMTLGEGAHGRLAPQALHQPDMALAVQVAVAMGALDIGQAAAVAGGVVLAVEAQEGTDAMLARCADLPAALRGTHDARLGVLIKWPKPIQDRRVDLPVIGVKTIEGAAAAGLAGVVGQAGGALVVDKPAVIAAADRLGLFLIGLPAGTTP